MIVNPYSLAFSILPFNNLVTFSLNTLLSTSHNKVLEDVLYYYCPLAAPTGSGKTVIIEYTVLNHTGFGDGSNCYINVC